MYRPSSNFLIAVAILGLLTIVGLSGCAVESQQSVDTVSWQHPTTREGGAALTLAEIDATIINWGPSGGPYTTGSVVVPAPATSIQIPRDATPGTRCYIAFTRDTAQRISAATSQVCKTVVGRPNPPSNVTVQ